MKTILALFVFIVSWSFIAMAQDASPAVAAVVPASGVMGWITAHGGFQASVLLLVGSALALLSGVRQVLYNFDGVAPGAAIPVGMKGLTLVNKICVIMGNIVDYITGNVAH